MGPIPDLSMEVSCQPRTSRKRKSPPLHGGSEKVYSSRPRQVQRFAFLLSIAAERMSGPPNLRWNHFRVAERIRSREVSLSLDQILGYVPTLSR